MKKMLCILAVALFLPVSALAGTFNTPFGTIPYNEARWSKHETKMPTAGSMAGEAAKSTAISEGGNVQIADSYGWKSPSSIRDSAIGAATSVAQSAAVGAVGGAVIESKIKGMVGDMAMATFKKKGKPYAEIMVTIMKGGSAPAAGMGQYGASSGSGESECKVIEQSKANWGGRSANIITTRCPAGNNEFQWTSSASMSKNGANYFMTAMFTGKGQTVSEFNSAVGSDMKSMMNGSKWK